MIDNFALFVSHGLMILCAWRVLFRTDLDVEPPFDDVTTVPEKTHARGWGMRDDA